MVKFEKNTFGHVDSADMHS